MKEMPFLVALTNLKNIMHAPMGGGGRDNNKKNSF